MAKVSYFKINLEENYDLRPILSLKRYLQQSIYEHLTATPLVNPPVSELCLFLSVSEIPLTPIVDPSHLGFRSAIAFKLAKHSPLTIADLALQLGARLGNNVQPNTNQREVLIKAEIIDHNWLVFSCNYRHFQVWLAHLAQVLIKRSQPSPSQGITASSPAAYCQYAHARACSLLRLIEQPEFGGLSQLPELPINLPTSARSLLEQLLRVTDQLTEEKLENGLKVAVNLSRAFLNFDQDFNLAKHQDNANYDLWNLNKLLLINTRLILQELLITQLNLAAPEEL